MSAYSDAVLALSPSLYWALDGTTGATDLSGNGRTGSAGGGVSIGGFASSPILGETTSTNFDGSDDRITSTYNPFTNGTIRSFCGWAYRDAPGSTGDCLFGATSGSPAAVVFQHHATDNEMDLFIASGGDAWFAAWPGNDQWALWGLVFNETTNTAEFLVNGVSKGTRTGLTDPYHASTGNFQVGAWSSGTDPYDGKMAHVFVVEGGVTAAQLAHLYDLAINGPPDTSPRTIAVRELPPLRQHILVTTPSGKTYRWGQDERHPDNVFSGLGYSTVMPGGNENFDCVLPRKTGVSYQDLVRLSDVTVKGAGGRVAWNGRLEKAPRSSGDEKSISPQVVGWQAHLEDDPEAAEVYVDTDLTKWGDVSATRKIALGTGGFSIERNLNVESDSTSVPKMSMGITGNFDDTQVEAMYDGRGARPAELVIGDIVRYGLANDANLTATPRAWDTDAAGGEQTGSSYKASSSLDFSPTAARYLVLNWTWSGAGPVGADSVDFGFRYGTVAVYGNHGLTKRGTASATNSQGFYASDVIANAVSRWAPLLRFTTGSEGTIKPTSFVIPQLEFRDFTTVAEILKEANKVHLNDWWVDEGPRPGEPTFHYAPRNSYGRKWRARVGPAKLQETGPQVDRLFNAVIVSYQDVDGSTRTVGPTGSFADATDASLVDTDPLNPINQLGIKRPGLLDMGIVSKSAVAIQVGARFLEESKQLDQSGSAELVGHVTDDRGIVHPAWAVRAGDQISFVDASDTSYRRIVRTQYDHDSRTNSLDLDSPPEGMDALLERLGASLLAGAPSVQTTQGHGPHGSHVS